MSPKAKPNRATATPPPPEPHDSEELDLVGAVIGDYAVIQPLGKGGMGAVYLARHRSLGREVAIKFLPAGQHTNKQVVERFLREARAAAQLNHRYIAHVYDFLRWEKSYCIVMEYVSGGTLGDRLREVGPFPEEEAANLLKMACSALGFAHNAGIIHRDIKPDNFLFTSEGTIKLCDLGLALITSEDSNLTMTGLTIGTPYYISPEQVRGIKDIDSRTDIYSLGATMFHLMTGKVPFDGGTAAEIMSKHLHSSPPTLHSVLPRLSNEISYIINRMMAKRREDRYTRCADVLNDMKRLKFMRAQLLEGSSDSSQVMETLEEDGDPRTSPAEGKKNDPNPFTDNVEASKTDVVVFDERIENIESKKLKEKKSTIKRVFDSARSLLGGK